MAQILLLNKTEKEDNHMGVNIGDDAIDPGDKLLVCLRSLKLDYVII